MTRRKTNTKSPRRPTTTSSGTHRRRASRHTRSDVGGRRRQDSRSAHQRRSDRVSSSGRNLSRIYGARWNGWQIRQGVKVLGQLDLPLKSIFTFVFTFIMLEHGHGLLVLVGVAASGSVWTMGTIVPATFVIAYLLCLVSAANVIRQVVQHIGNRRDNLVKALFRGYLWALLAVGLVSVVHLYFCVNAPEIFAMSLYFVVPIQVYGFTIPIPFGLGFTGPLMEFGWQVVVFAIGITGGCVGGIELLRYLTGYLSERGLYASLLQVLLLAVFPGVNMAFSILLVMQVDPFIELIVVLTGQVMS